MLRTLKFGLHVFLLASLALGASQTLAQAEKYPERSIRLIVPFSPGGSTDGLARIIGAGLTETLGQQVVVDNRTGAGGNIGVGLAAAAKPDGYTMVIVASGFVVNPSLYSKVSYDPVKDFAPVTYLASVPSMLVATPSLGVKTVKDLVDLAKSGRRITYGSPGYGSHQHLGAELFKRDAGIDLVHVPYKGAGPAATAALGGEVNLAVLTVVTALPQMAAGKLVGLAITSSSRSPAAPDVPTFIESGYPGLEADQMQGILVPAGTPQPIVAKLNAEIVKIISAPGVREQLVKRGFVPVGSSPAEFAQIIKSEAAKWREIVKGAKLRVD